MGTIYGVSTSIELDWCPIDKIRIYPEIGYALALKIQTVIPKKRDVHYIKAGAGVDYLLNVSENTALYAGVLGGGMAHINNNKVTITPYFGTRVGFETKIAESLYLGAMVRVTGALLYTDNTLTDSLTLLVDPASITLRYVL